MLRFSRGASRTLALAAAFGVAGVLALVPTTAANAATTIDGPISLGNAAPFAVLGNTTVTNTGPSVISGDVGVDPGTSITGFPPGIVNGTIHATDQPAILGQASATTAFSTLASLSPKASGLVELGGKTLSPGVYAGGGLQITGDLRLKGSASSVWVFQASSTLTAESSSRVLISGGASSCNVFWEVGSSATLESGSTFSGSIIALASITANTTATVQGRLLALTGAVTLDTNTITRPGTCTTSAGSTVATTPKITSGTPDVGGLGQPYSYQVGASGTPHPKFSVSSGALPPGLSLNASTGVISGTPDAVGTFHFTITARNSAVSRASRAFVISVTRSGTLALTGMDPAPELLAGSALAAAGLVLVFLARRRRPLHRS